MRDELLKSIASSGFEVKPLGKGRFIEEENLALFNSDCRLNLKVFYGRGKHIRPWAELFNIRGGFFDSEVEVPLYRSLLFFSWIFVEYELDRQTMLELERGIEPKDTRLGIQLLKAGYRSLRDWYFPEGWMEGGRKIQAFAPEGRGFMLK